MRKLIVGSQALANGAVTEHDLRWWYDRMFRDIYWPKGYEPTLLDRIDGAWLRLAATGVVAGVAASSLHGAQWVDDDIPIELIWDNTRPPPGIVARDERLEQDEITTVSCISVTTSARTAYDLGRHLPRGEAVARLDALMRATRFSMDEVLGLAQRHRRARGLKQLRAVLPLVDGGAASPQETRLRLLFIDDGFPRPTTQILAVDGRAADRARPRHGVGGLHGRCRVRRGPTPQQPQGVRQRHADIGKATATRLDRDPRDQGGPRRGHH